MQLITGDRRSGKTTQLLEMLAQAGQGAVLVCSSADLAAHTFRMARELELSYDQEKRPAGIKRSQILSTYEAKRHRGYSGPVFVDNLDQVLYDLFGAPCAAVSLTVNGGEKTIWPNVGQVQGAGTSG